MWQNSILVFIVPVAIVANCCSLSGDTSGVKSDNFHVLYSTQETVCTLSLTPTQYFCCLTKVTTRLNMGYNKTISETPGHG